MPKEVWSFIEIEKGRLHDTAPKMAGSPNRLFGLIRQGNIRSVRLIHNEKALIDIPLTVGGPIAAATVLAVPVLAAVGITPRVVSVAPQLRGRPASFPPRVLTSFMLAVRRQQKWDILKT